MRLFMFVLAQVFKSDVPDYKDMHLAVEEKRQAS